MVTVVIPIINKISLPYLEAISLRSLVWQTMKDFKVIVASEEGYCEETEKFINSYKDRLNIKYIHCQRESVFESDKKRHWSGGGHGRNVANAQADTEFIACLDHDDLFLPNHLHNVMNFIAGNPDVQAVYTSARSVCGIKINTLHNFGNHWNPDTIKNMNFLAHSSMVYLKSDIEYNLDGSGPADWLKWKEFAKNGYVVQCIDTLTCICFQARKDLEYNWKLIEEYIDTLEGDNEHS